MPAMVLAMVGNSFVVISGAPPSARQSYVQTPWSMTMSPRWFAVRNCAFPPSVHMDTVSVSPGITGLENRAFMERNLAGSPPQSACNRARPVKP